MLKLFYKIVAANRKIIITYLSIFIMIFVLFTTIFSVTTSTPNAVYEQKKPNVAIINLDNSEFSKCVEQQLQKENKVGIAFKDTEDAKDALFFAQVDAIITIPQHFQKAFEAGNDHLIQIQLRPQDANGVLIEQKINSFLTAVRYYRQTDTSLSYQDASVFVSKNLNQKANISYHKAKKVRDNDMLRNLYYNFLSYILFSVIVMTLGSAMHSIYRSEMLKRSLISPINSTKMNMKVVLANLSFGVALWALFTIIILIARYENMFTQAGALYILNSLIFTLMCIAFAFMVATFISNKRNGRDKMDMITNIFGLIGGFLGGAFLPQALIPKSILKISYFLPNYWYIKLSDLLSNARNISSSLFKTSLQCMGIQLLFTIAFLTIGLVVMKNKRSQGEIINNDFE